METCVRIFDLESFFVADISLFVEKFTDGQVIKSSPMNNGSGKWEVTVCFNDSYADMENPEFNYFWNEIRGFYYAHIEFAGGENNA